MPRLLAIVILGALAGCPHQKKDPAAVPAAGLPPGPGIQSFSETQPYTSLAMHAGALYAGTATGLLRYKLGRSEAPTRLAMAQGLPGASVLALAAHPTAGLWVATDGGVAHLKTGAWIHVGSAPVGEVTALAVTSKVLWAGGNGVARYVNGRWQSFLPGARVSYMLVGLDGETLWVGTDGEGIYQHRGGRFEPHSAAQGQVIRRVRCMTHTAEGGLFAVGHDGAGDRLAFFDGTHWTAFAVEPAAELRWVQIAGRDTLLAYGSRLVALEQVAGDVERGREPVGPVKLTGTPSPRAPAGYPAPRFFTRVVERWRLPVATTVVRGQEQRLLLATPALGAAVFDGQKLTWYRTGALVGRGERLRVGCSGGACYLAGGEGRAYRYDGQRFVPTKLEGDALAFLDDGRGALLAMTSLADGHSLVVSRLAGGRFARMFQTKITIPPGRVMVRFARFDPAGKLWLGLGYADQEGDHPWGVAVLSEGAPPLYHRSTMLPTEDRGEGSLALPDDVRDVLFAGGDIWLATGTGVCRVRGSTVDLFTENEGLESEIVYAVARSARGEILAACRAGVGRYEGKWWRFSLDDGGPLSRVVRALLPAGETVWVGSSVGVVQWVPQSRSRVIDVDQGLASNTVLDLYLEGDRRLWVLTDQGLSLLPL